MRLENYLSYVDGCKKRSSQDSFKGFCLTTVILRYSAFSTCTILLTGIEIKTGLRNLRLIGRHPTVIRHMITGGRVSAIKKAVNISLSQLSGMDIRHPISIIQDGKVKSLLGKMGGYSQEMLYFLVRYYRPKVVVETGVYRGISSAFILKAIEDNGFGRLYSIDLPMAKYTDDRGEIDYSPLSKSESTGFAVPDELRSNWSLILGDSRKELPKLLEKLGEIDLFYHDSEHSYEMMTWEYNTVYPYLQKGGLICSDDISWNTAFPDFCVLKSLKPYYLESKFGFSTI